jgi:hypothetical protein
MMTKADIAEFEELRKARTDRSVDHSLGAEPLAKDGFLIVANHRNGNSALSLSHLHRHTSRAHRKHPEACARVAIAEGDLEQAGDCVEKSLAGDERLRGTISAHRRSIRSRRRAGDKSLSVRRRELFRIHRQTRGTGVQYR